MDIIYPMELPTKEEVMTGLRKLLNDVDLDIRQKAWLLELALEFKDIFCYKPVVFSLHPLSWYLLGCSPTGLIIPGGVKLPFHKINPNGLYCVKPHKVSIEVQETINAAMDDMLLMGIIHKFVSEWAHLVIIVIKKDRKPLVCINYRELNKWTVKDSSPMLNVEDTNQSEGQELQSSIRGALCHSSGKRHSTGPLLPLPLKLMGKSQAREHQRRKAGIIALDPGVRTFMTTYNSCREVTEWGKVDINEIGKLCHRLSCMQSKGTKGNHRQWCRL
ncbi:Transposase [Balamuthia mandrillaris]